MTSDDTAELLAAALETAQTHLLAATDEVEDIGPSLDRALSDIDIDESSAAADRALQSLRDMQDALDTMAVLLRSTPDDQH